MSPYEADEKEKFYIAKFNSTSGINENSLNNQVSIFPNPSDGQIKIESSIRIEGIKITDPFGQITYQTQANEKNISLQLDKSGIFFITLTADKRTLTEKIIVCK